MDRTVSDMENPAPITQQPVPEPEPTTTAVSSAGSATPLGLSTIVDKNIATQTMEPDQEDHHHVHQEQQVAPEVVKKNEEQLPETHHQIPRQGDASLPSHSIPIVGLPEQHLEQTIPASGTQSAPSLTAPESQAGDDVSQTHSTDSMLLSVDNFSDADSALGGFSVQTSTASLRSSMYDFVVENGRRWHRFKEGTYHLPNDETEQDRLDLQHHIWLMCLNGRLHLAPLDTVPGGIHNVIDIGCGTGIWAIEFANEFSSANVLGTDLSPIQPDFVPPNCRFEIDDAEDEWLFSQKFEFVHGRMLATCFTDHKTVFENVFKGLKSGGYFEMQDIVIPLGYLDDSYVGSAFDLYMQRVVAGATKLGKDVTRVSKYKSIYEEVGFVDVEEKHFQWPIGTWAKGQRMKTLGAWTKEDFLSGMQGVAMGLFTRGLGMTPQEVELFLVDVRNELNSNKVHVYFPINVIYGRKP